MMVPLRCARMAGRTVLMQLNAPFKLTSTTRWKSCIVTLFQARFGTLVPALLIRMSTRPWRVSSDWAARATPPASLTSSTCASALPLAARTAATALSSSDWRRPERTMWTEGSAMASAVALPMPVPPPVIQMTLLACMQEAPSLNAAIEPCSASRACTAMSRRTLLLATGCGHSSWKPRSFQLSWPSRAAAIPGKPRARIAVHNRIQATSGDSVRQAEIPRGETPLVGPGPFAPKAEIVGIGLSHGLARFWLHHVIGEAIALRIGHGFFLAVEVEADLGLHVARTRPTHQGLDFAGCLRLKLEHPLFGAGRPGLHGGLGRLIDTGGHRPIPKHQPCPERQDLAGERLLIGARHSDNRAKRARPIKLRIASACAAYSALHRDRTSASRPR